MRTNSMVTLLAVLVMLASSFSVHAGTSETGSANGFIEGSYILTFKESTDSTPSLILPPLNKRETWSGRQPPPPQFGEHGTGQSREELAAALGLAGQVVSIFETINAAHIKMDAAEADRIRRHPQVLEVEQDRRTTLQTTQSNPGWGLDRLDQATPPLNNTYVYSTDGAGQTIYILDSGLDLSKAAVAAEFGGRASIIYDVNGGAGYDCLGHGTEVASAAGGNTKGVAKGASLVIAKLSNGCTASIDVSTVVMAYNWLAANAPRGTIVNLSAVNFDGSGNCSNFPFLSMSLENAITAAYNAGIILVMAAGNDGCDTSRDSYTRLPQAFVVGATDSSRLGYGQDAKASYSRTGTNISTFAPGSAVPLIDQNGSPVTVNGTSFSAPYIAGVFAVACQSVIPYCSSNDTGVLYQALRDTGILGTVTNADGTPLTGATSRFIWKQAW